MWCGSLVTPTMVRTLGEKTISLGGSDTHCILLFSNHRQPVLQQPSDEGAIDSFVNGWLPLVKVSSFGPHPPLLFESDLRRRSEING